MAKRFLLDTGFVVALANDRDPDHALCKDVWAGLRGALLSVEGVLVEAAHLLRRARGGPAAAIHIVYGSGARVVAASEERARRAIVLMDRYRDVPMDYVDATLVALAEEHDVSDVLTLDRRGFETYRIKGKGRFRILP